MVYSRVTLLLAFCSVVGVSAARAQTPREGAAPATQSEGPALCAGCHVSADAGKEGALGHGDVGTCLACHHIGFTNDPVTAANRRIDACEGCHEDIRLSHFDAEAADAPTCGSCHSIHGEPDMDAAHRVISGRCVSCHTTSHPLHDGVGTEAPECTQCHLAHAPAAANPERLLAKQCAACHEEIHPSHADVVGGLTCTDCHRVAAPHAGGATAGRSSACIECHDDVLLPHASAGADAPECLQCHTFDTDEPLAQPERTMSTHCAACHVDQWDDMLAGGHRMGLDEDVNADLPTCLTCHASHVDPAEERGNTRLAATVRCIECHSRRDLIEAYELPENVAASYTGDYHGATVRFLWNHPAGEGQPAVLICADCHGAHNVGWSDSSVLSAVCAECHEADDARLAGAWLGHDPVGPRNAMLVWIVRAFYYTLIPFMLGGLFLYILFDLRNQHRSGARLMKSAGVQRIKARLRGKATSRPRMVTRFSITERVEHLGTMVTFILLVVTGLPQTRPDGGISNAIVGFFGGIANTRLLHRIVAFAFVALLVTHVARAVVNAIRKRRLPIMVADRKDFEDGVQIVRHYLFGEPRPKAGKFDLAAKFEYWGLFLGSVLMTVTGLVLVFPEFTARFLPGVFVAAMRTMHGLEATFAVLVVVLWHSWGVIFRPEVFPLDTTIFTGKMSLERLREEHPLEYKRLFPNRGVIEEHDEAATDPGTTVLPLEPELVSVE